MYQLLLRGVPQEEAGQGPGELPAVGAAVDEAEPVLGDALEAAERPGGHAREYPD